MRVMREEGFSVSSLLMLVFCLLGPLVVAGMLFWIFFNVLFGLVDS